MINDLRFTNRRSFYYNSTKRLRRKSYTNEYRNPRRKDSNCLSGLFKITKINPVKKISSTAPRKKNNRKLILPRFRRVRKDPKEIVMNKPGMEEDRPKRKNNFFKVKKVKKMRMRKLKDRTKRRNSKERNERKKTPRIIHIVIGD